MTVRINFLPQTSRPPKHNGVKRWGPAAAAAVALVAGASYYANLYSGTLMLEQRAHENQVLLSDLKNKLADANQIKATEEKVAKEEQALQALAGREWSGVLLDLRNLDPQHVVWTGLEAAENHITLTGTSDGLLNLAQLLGGLVDNTEIAEVTLHFVNEQGIPVAVTAKAGQAAPTTITTPILLPPPGAHARLEFELAITLVATEGRQMTNAS